MNNNRVTGKFVVSSAQLNVKQENKTISTPLEIISDMRGHPNLKEIKECYEHLPASDLMFAFEDPSRSYEDYKLKPSYMVAMNFMDFYFTLEEPNDLMIQDLLEATVLCFDSLWEVRPQKHPICAAISNSGAKNLEELREYLQTYENEDMIYTFVAVPLNGIYYAPPPVQNCILV